MEKFSKRERVRSGEALAGPTYGVTRPLVDFSGLNVAVHPLMASCYLQGDLVDSFLISLAISVYVYMSMELWRLYAFMVQQANDPFL